MRNIPVSTDSLLSDALARLEEQIPAASEMGAKRAIARTFDIPKDSPENRKLRNDLASVIKTVRFWKRVIRHTMQLRWMGVSEIPGANKDAPATLLPALKKAAETTQENLETGPPALIGFKLRQAYDFSLVFSQYNDSLGMRLAFQRMVVLLEKLEERDPEKTSLSPDTMLGEAVHAARSLKDARRLSL